MPYNGSDLTGQYLYMEGRSVFKWAIRVLVETIRDVIAPPA